MSQEGYQIESKYSREGQTRISILLLSSGIVFISILYIPQSNPISICILLYRNQIMWMHILDWPYWHTIDKTMMNTSDY